MIYYYQIAVNFPLYNSLLTYQSEQIIDIGRILEVPLGKRKELGCVIATIKHPPTDIEIKSISLEQSYTYVLDSATLKLFTWMASYYQYSLGQVIFDFLPKFMKQPRKFNPIDGEGKNFNYELTQEQKNIVSSLKEKLHKKIFSANYLHGITGAGKTTVYIELMKSCLEKNQSVLFLIPEINLTPQFTEILKTYLNCQIFLYHSNLTNSDRYNLLMHLSQPHAPLVLIGVRSSIFLPIQNLGLIIVDEEHDGSFKQDDRCTYNARDVAIKRAQIEEVPVILGSATPSIENYYRFTKTANHENYFSLKNRPGNVILPQISLVDERKAEGQSTTAHWPLQSETLQKIEQSLLKGEQVLVFINRLGFANFIQCRACGHQFYCPNCSVTLKYFKKKSKLECQHCDFKITFPQSCPKCQCLTLEQRGYGTERITDILRNYFPERKIERFDRDEIKNLKQLEARLDDFHQQKIDILVGTQMLSKGHNFKKVNLVVILGIDAQLNFPDFRSNEKVFQLLTQVAGRAGRYGGKSEVLIQTLAPENPLFNFLINNELTEFYNLELQIRETCFCPPFSRMALVYFTSRFQERVADYAQKQAEILAKLKTQHFNSVVISSARPTNIEKKSNQFSWCVMIKSREVKALHDLIHTYQLNRVSVSGVSIKIDIDPYTQA